jgi:hypothetical protein
MKRTDNDVLNRGHNIKVLKLVDMEAISDKNKLLKIPLSLLKNKSSAFFVFGTNSKQTNFNVKSIEEEKSHNDENLIPENNENIVISPLKFKQNFYSANISKKGSPKRTLSSSKMVSTGTQSGEVNLTKAETFIIDPRTINQYNYIDHLDKAKQNFKGPSSLCVNEKFKKLKEKLIKFQTGYWHTENEFDVREENQGKISTETEMHLFKENLLQTKKIKILNANILKKTNSQAVLNTKLISRKNSNSVQNSQVNSAQISQINSYLSSHKSERKSNASKSVIQSSGLNNSKNSFISLKHQPKKNMKEYYSFINHGAHLPSKGPELENVILANSLKAAYEQKFNIGQLSLPKISTKINSYSYKKAIYSDKIPRIKILQSISKV